MSSAVDLCKVAENFSMEIQSNSVKTIPTECLTVNFIPTKFKELLAEEHCEGLLFKKTVTVSAFLTSFFADLSFFNVQ